jgi:hypothetical protein
LEKEKQKENQMNLEKVLWNDRVWIQPDSQKDWALWRHCTEGYTAVLNKNFNKEIKPILEAHNVNIYITDRSRRTK